MMAAGVPLGATHAVPHVDVRALQAGLRQVVGTSGSCAMRLGLPVAMTFSLPALICGSATLQAGTCSPGGPPAYR